MEGSNFRCWDDLLPDVLGLIFKKLALEEVLTVVPRVCKSWGRAVLGPYCWQEIDIEEWSHHSEPCKVDRMLRLLITRSSGCLRKLCVAGLQSELIFSFIADSAPSLHTLRLPRSSMNDSIAKQIACKLSLVTFLDLSYCSHVGAPALEVIGKQCKLLSGLRRNMHPLDIARKLSQNDEAHAIATSMPKIKHLEMAYLLIDTTAALEIILSCSELEYLDMRGCWDVKIDDRHLIEKFPKLNILGPQVIDHFEKNELEVCSDYSDSSYDYESSDGMWDDEERLEGLELRFYNGLDDSVYEWPPSP
ncbi:hypothetical protein Leryth_017519 [Lithospermum erythrorhizon]|nr:hypothetical protein Leryth_017519 [Lithospermum erythrorhizon]